MKDYKNFGDFRKALNDSICKSNKGSFEEIHLQLTIDNKKLTIPLMQPICEYGIFDWKDRNRLTITRYDDSKNLEKHLLNYDKNRTYSQHPRDAFLFINLTDEEKIESLNKIIIGIIQEYAFIINKQCQRKYKKAYEKCSEEELNAILKEIPLRIKTRETESGFL
ncbi:hypothetical protein Q0590_11040 [Rhodocytophaga aerolata]|uniref:DUF4304 domain-containing protein n=1 Tax=Rhodocytophaga aerolata TaxID=455078 RepID=A0ABT8R3V9_9BACT|nr:hypothetical protein [Rhodocytophaga aerolata]MDO1446791.1 hypothetical protein [Rhodocytophaga aerolata]